MTTGPEFINQWMDAVNRADLEKLVSCLRSSHSEAGDAGEDIVCGFHPHKRFGVGIMCGEEQADRVLQRPRTAVASAPNLLLGQLGEPAFHLVDPGRVGRCEVEMETWMAE